MATGTDERYRKLLARVVSAMVAGLNTYGKKADAALFDLWTMAVAPVVAYEMLEPTCAWFAREQSDFPTPHEFIEKATELHERAVMDARLEMTKLELKEIDRREAIGRRERNVLAGIDPDSLIPIIEVKGLMQNAQKALMPRGSSRTADSSVDA